MSKTILFIGAAIFAIAGMGTFAVLHSRNQAGVCLNNGRPFDDASLARMKQEDAIVASLVPLGTAFTNAVAALGGDYTTVRVNETTYYAQFKCVLPGLTNYSYVHLRVESNTVVWAGYIKIRFPAHSSDASQS